MSTDLAALPLPAALPAQPRPPLFKSQTEFRDRYWREDFKIYQSLYVPRRGVIETHEMALVKLRARAASKPGPDIC